MQRLFGSKKHPKGPDFRQARLLEFDLSGTKFRMKAPPHTEPKYPPAIGSSSSNIYDVTRYSTNSKMEGAPLAFSDRHVEYWPFYGLPFIHGRNGRLGRMSFSFVILKTSTNRNLFNPIQFEKFIHLLIEKRHAPPEGGWSKEEVSFREYRVPVDWTVKKINGVSWVSYSAHSLHCREHETLFLTPITDQHTIYITFSFHDYTSDEYCQRAFQDLMNQIASSFEVELSPLSKDEKAEAERRWPNARYSEYIPEREWSKAS